MHERMVTGKRREAIPALWRTPGYHLLARLSLSPTFMAAEIRFCRSSLGWLGQQNIRNQERSGFTATKHFRGLVTTSHVAIGKLGGVH